MFTEWDRDKNGYLTEGQLTEGLNERLISIRQQNTGGAAQSGARRGRGSAGGAGGGGRAGRGGVDLDPLVLLDDASRPLASKLLAVPELRKRYLSYVRDIAKNWLDWGKIGPHIIRYQTLIEEDVKTDTRKLNSTEAFYAGFESGQGAEAQSLKGFLDLRRSFLLKHEAVSNAMHQ